MATITNAGEILTVNGGDKRDKNRGPVPFGSKKKYVHYKKFDIDGVPYESDDSDSTSFDDENDDDGFRISPPISPPSAPTVPVRSDQESAPNRKTSNPRTSNDDENDDGGSPMSPPISPPPPPAVQNDQESAAPNRNTSNRHLLYVTASFGSRRSVESGLSEATPINFHEPKFSQSFSSNKTKGSAMSEATPINFHEPEDGSHSVSLHSKKSEGSVLSETTPIKFHESSADFDLDVSSDESSEGNTKPERGFREFQKASQRSLGKLTLAEKKASQRFQSELFDKAIDEDAERDIVNVYLEASAFADRERINLTEDIYSFILACSYFSMSFWFAIYFIILKYICYGVIVWNLQRNTYEGEDEQLNVLCTKILLIPVTVAMQEDLITVYYNAANKKYDALTLKGNIHATESKWGLCNLLRALDGLLSLVVNFLVMVFDNDLLNIFLSFAALHFLQFIDDVIYELAEKGFFGHRMEQATIACKIITFTRRTQNADSWNNFITNLDTIFLVGSFVLLIAIYILIVLVYYSSPENNFFTPR